VNGDPYRSAPQPADRRVINRSGAAATPQRAAEEPQPIREEAPRSTPRSSQIRRSDEYDDEKKSRKGLLWTIIIALLVIILAIVGWFAFTNAKSSTTGIDTGKYQAIFLSNGQVYFGKLSDFNEQSYKLTNIYYPQAQADSKDEDAEDTAASTGIKLIRLGDEVHGPENEMFITKEQTLYYENLKSDSKVSGLIDQNEKNK